MVCTTDTHDGSEVSIEVGEVAEKVGVCPVCFEEGAKKVYALGGYYEVNNICVCRRSIECYDIDLNSWSMMLSELPGGRSSSATYLIGGEYHAYWPGVYR